VGGAHLKTCRQLDFEQFDIKELTRLDEVTEAQLPKSDNSIPELVVVRSSIERFFFRMFIVIIPAIYILYAALEYIDLRVFPHALLDFVKIPTEIALMIALVFSNLLFAAIPDTISQLFSSKAISQKTSDADHKSMSVNSFVRSFDFWLNHDLRRLTGLLSALFAFTYYTFRIGGLSEMLPQAGFTLSYVDRLLYILPTVAYAYFVGIVVWKLLVTSITLQSIPKNFDVNMQFGHPDSAGGLLPVGMLCLNMVYVTVANRVLLYSFAPLILLAGIIGSIFGLLPILKFHQAMLMHKKEMVDLLNQVSNEVVELKASLIEMAEDTDQKSIDDTLKKIRSLESFYKDHQDINTWPMNKQVLVRIWGTQTFLFGQVVVLWNLVSRF
jgi:hypothetical protein